MKELRLWIAAVVAAAGLASCSSAYYAASGYAGDDLYVQHDRAQIARKQQAEAEVKKAEAEARRAEWEARIAEAQAAAAENDYYEYRSADSNPYQSILADDYESAYARRLRGFESPTYRMPSSYINARYSSAFTYASAYDPAFYNVIVMGDEVWVEPKYITSMFLGRAARSVVLRLELAVGPVVLDRQLGLEFRLECLVPALVCRVVQPVVRSLVGTRLGLGARLASPSLLGPGLGARLGAWAPLGAASELSLRTYRHRRRIALPAGLLVGRQPLSSGTLRNARRCDRQRLLAGLL